MNPAQKSSPPASDSSCLSLEGVYICPICRHGQISALVLTDAFGCDFCRHIFTANLATQSVHVVDSAQPLAWRWNGRAWSPAYRGRRDLSLTIWIVGIILITLPTILVGASAYLFPPLDGSACQWFPLLWVGLTFSTHLALVSWLVAEYYQLPWYITLKFRLLELRER